MTIETDEKDKEIVDGEIIDGAVAETGDDDVEEISQEEAEASFEQGFLTTAGIEPAEPTEEEKATAEEEATAKADVEAEAAAEAEAKANDEAEAKAEKDFLKDLPNQIRSIHGKIGGLKSDLNDSIEKLQGTFAKAKEASDASSDDSPSKNELDAALTDPEAMDKLLVEYPDFQPVADELKAIREKIDSASADASNLGGGNDAADDDLGTTETGSVDVEAITKEAEEKAYLRLKHPEWRKTTTTAEFKTYMLEGGPSDDAYKALNEIEGADMQNAKLKEYADAFPEWWKTKGKLIFSPSANDATTLLDGYQASVDKAAEAVARKERNDKRLRSNVTAESSGSTGKQEDSEEQQFENGFKKVRGQK